MRSAWKNFSIFPKQYGLMPYMYLVYIFFPVYYMLLEDGWKQLLGFTLIGIFLLSYRQLYFLYETKSFTIWLCIQMTIVLILSISYDSNYIFLGFFPAYFISWYQTKKLFLYALTYLAVCIILPFVYLLSSNNNDWFFLLPFIIIMIISPLGFRTMNAKVELEKQLNVANEQIKELVKREERLRIARDLHDTLGHTLSLITLKSQLVVKLINKDDDRARTEAKEIESTSRSALTQVRDLVADMRMISIPEQLMECQAILEAAGITYTFSGNAHLSNVSFIHQHILGMCLLESVTNIVKHSSANHCSISLEQSNKEINLKVQDNGVGISSLHPDGNGLIGMEERLAIINGTLTIMNLNGTLVDISVPIISQEKKGEVI